MGNDVAKIVVFYHIGAAEALPHTQNVTTPDRCLPT